MLTKLTVIITSQYVYDKPLFCIPKTYIVLFFNYISEISLYFYYI